jgi:hypothetical protein
MMPELLTDMRVLKHLAKDRTTVFHLFSLQLKLKD